MRLHVLAGCRQLLQPELLGPDTSADLIGPKVRAATASWISPKLGHRYHGFLQDEPGDRRTTTMALALNDEYGIRFEPLLILIDLLDEVVSTGGHAPSAATVSNRRTQLTVLSELLATGQVQHLQLIGLALPAKVDPDGSWAVPAGIVPGTVRDRIEKLRSVCADMASHTIETRVIAATPDLPAFNALYNNALCNHFVLRLSSRLCERGWTVDPGILAVAISRIIAKWNEKGIFLALPLYEDRLTAMADLMYEHLLRE